MTAHVGNTLFLRDAAFRSQAFAGAEVPRSFFGRVRALWEFATGSVITGDTPCTSPNPDGELGVNLSGPPWGSAVLHPIAWIGGLKEPATSVMWGARPLTGSAGIAPGGKFTVADWSFRSRRYARTANQNPGATAVIPPYSRGIIIVRGWASAGSVTAGVRAWNNTIQTRDATTREADLTYSATTEANASSPGNLFFDLTPSGWNSCTLEFTNEDATDTLHITSIGVVQAVKRSH